MEKKQAIGYLHICNDDYSIGDQKLIMNDWCEKNNANLLHLSNDLDKIETAISDGMVLLIPTISALEPPLIESLKLLDRIKNKGSILCFADTGLDFTNEQDEFIFTTLLSVLEGQQKIKQATKEKIIRLNNGIK